jgi:site-specific recombinase XerD
MTATPLRRRNTPATATAPTTASTTRAPLRDARRAGAATLSAVHTESAAGTGAPGSKVRAGTKALYAAHLDSATSDAGDRYGDKTIKGYVEAVASLGAYLSRAKFTGDFHEVTFAELNAYLADYRDGHTQGGTNTKQRRLRTFYGWLEIAYEVPSPWRSGRVSHYRPSEPPSSTLGDGVFEAMIATCSDAHLYEDVRDAAMLHVLKTGMRRAELAGLFVEDLDFAGQWLQVCAVKDARRDAPILRIVDGVEYRAGRLVPLNSAALVANHKWLRMRAGHKLVTSADAGPLWYGTRNRIPMTGSGILRMVKRRARQAGFDPATIGAHAFRHTRAHELLSAGVAEGDVMGVMGWKDRAMIDRYAKELKNARSIEAVRKAGLA